MSNINKHPLINVLRGVTKYSCPYNINLHTHTIHSDGSLNPDELINKAESIGLKHLAITDHHSIKAFSLIDQELKNSYNVKLWSGVEISGLLKGCLVHILGLGFDTKSQSIQKYLQGHSAKGSLLSAASVVNSIHQANGLCVLAHPARYRLSFNELILEAKNLDFDAVEVWYDYDRKSKWKPSDFICTKIFELVNSLNMLSTCGTDTHGTDLLKR